LHAVHFVSYIFTDPDERRDTKIERLPSCDLVFARPTTSTDLSLHIAQLLHLLHNTMAPIPKYSSDNILALSNHDFFKNGQCPMRAGNVRCRNISMCTRVHYGDQSAPEKAEKLRNQLIQHVKSLAAERSPPYSLVWNNIETKVAMLVDWVVCKKHLAQCETAVCMTIDFLKQDCGVFVEEESAQPGYLATPPPTPAAYFPSQAWQYAKQYPSVVHASVPIKKEPASSQMSASSQMFGQSELPQRAAFNFAVDEPMKTEPITSFFAPQVQQSFPTSPSSNASDSNELFGANPTRPQHVPFGFGVRTPTNTEYTVNTPSPKQLRAQTVEPQSSAGPAIRSPASVQFSKHQPTKQEVPFGFGVRSRTKDKEGTVPQPTQSSTLKEKLTFSCDGCKMLQAQKDASDETSRSQMDQLVKDNKAMELRLRKLVDENRRLGDENQKISDHSKTLAVDSKTLVNDKQRLTARYHAADDQAGELEQVNADLQSQVDSAGDRVKKLESEKETLQSQAKNDVNTIGDLEDENDSLKSKLATSEEVVERLEKELAALKKPLLSRLGVW
jgi:hypothetical protein